jgi:hypothetical protein
MEKFFSMFATTQAGTLNHQGAMVKQRMKSNDWMVAIADGSNPDSLMALGDFLGYGSIADSDIEMFSFPAGPTCFIVATLRGQSFDLESVQDYFPNHPVVEGHGWDQQKPSLIIADYAEAPHLFDGFMGWIDRCNRELN